MKKSQIAIILPVYHEEKNILKVLQKIRSDVKTPHEILIIYDDKTDPTYTILKNLKKKYHIRLIQNNIDTKTGVLNAIKTGFMYAKPEAVVVLMADLSDNISQIDAMYQKIREGYDIVCASRYMKHGKKIGGEFLKSFLSKFAGLSLYYIFGMPTHDATNAFKMYRKSIFKEIHIESTQGFVYSLEILIKAHAKHLRIAEIPTIWKDREAGRSNFKLIDWLPSYIKTYLSIFTYTPLYAFFTHHSVLVFLLYGFTMLLTTLQIGYQIRHKIPLGSTLDFSWKSDLIERLLHGYIAGKDFIFTYGPLYQYIESLPALIFHIPSYAAVIAAHYIFVSMVFFGIYLLSYFLTKNTTERLALLAYFLFFLGLGSLETAEQNARILPILLFSLYLYRFIYNQKSLHFLLILGAVIPSFLGMYTYDLFIQCIVLTLIFMFFGIYQFFAVKKSLLPLSIFFISIFGFQLLTSFLLTGGMQYIFGSVDTLTNYLYIMNIPWAYGTSMFLFLFPLALPILFIFLFFSNNITSMQKSVFFILMITALLQLRTTFVRSDEGHIIAGIYPSIIVLFLFLFYLIKKRFYPFIILCSIFFIFLPFKPLYTYALSPKNIFVTYNFFQNPQSFLSLYSLPEQFSFSENDLKMLKPLLLSHPGRVFIYPYDSYVLNTQNQTYNSYALQLYEYSVSFTEQETVKRFEKNPPMYVILAIDGKTAIALDEIPNLTRNPLIARFILDKYVVEKQTPRYLLLKYQKKKLPTNTTPVCTLKKITISLAKKNMLLEGFTKFVKPSLLYLEIDSKRIRLPYKPNVSSYLIVDTTNSRLLTALFSQKIRWDTTQQNETKLINMQLYKQFPFSKNQVLIPSTDRQLNVICLN